MTRFQLAATTSLAVLMSTTAWAAATPAYVTSAVSDTTRPKDDRDADAIRLPAETLAFSGVKPGMTVGELYPCGGYFGHMISNVVGPKGKVYGLETTRWKGCYEGDTKMIATLPVQNYTAKAEDFGAFTLPEPVDVFWITQNYHDLHIKEYGNVDMAAFNKHVFDSVKKGGTYFIVDHQANAGTDEAAIAKLHRIEKVQVIREAEAAGFKFAGEGKFLHRASDDHTKSIFDPSVKGHTDQYALKFTKP